MEAREFHMPLLRIAQYVVASSLLNDKSKRQETIARIKWIDFIPEQDFVTPSISRDLVTSASVEVVK